MEWKTLFETLKGQTLWIKDIIDKNYGGGYILYEIVDEDCYVERIALKKFLVKGQYFKI